MWYRSIRQKRVGDGQGKASSHLDFPLCCKEHESGGNGLGSRSRCELRVSTVQRGCVDGREGEMGVRGEK